MCSHPTSLATSLSPVTTATSSQPAISTLDMPTTRTYSIGSNLRRRVSTPCNHHSNHHPRLRPISMVSVTTNSDLRQENSEHMRHIVLLYHTVGTGSSTDSDDLSEHLVDNDPTLLNTVARRLWEK